jgi:hypothetical protein
MKMHQVTIWYFLTVLKLPFINNDITLQTNAELKNQFIMRQTFADDHNAAIC